MNYFSESNMKDFVTMWHSIWDACSPHLPTEFNYGPFNYRVYDSLIESVSNEEITFRLLSKHEEIFSFFFIKTEDVIKYINKLEMKNEN